MKAISVRQPWAWLLIHGPKDIENRDWFCGYRGEIAIHAAKGMTFAEYRDCIDFVARIDASLAVQMPLVSEYVRGAIIGTMNMRGCVKESRSPWFVGKYGLLMDTPQPWDPIPCRGQLGLWTVPEHLLEPA